MICVSHDESGATQHALEIIDSFCVEVGSGKFFASTDPTRLRALRRDLSAALNGLLVWQRPQLQQRAGLMWPYQSLAKCYEVFSQLARAEKPNAWSQQAQLFLALLPFPRQWDWLSTVTRQFPQAPEVVEFLLAEQDVIGEKYRHKDQTRFKLRHFCQVLKPFRSDREKGILRIFSIPYVLVALHPDLLSWLNRRYVLFVEPPMGIVFRHAWWRYFAELEEPCLVGIGSPEDIQFLNQQTHMEPIALAHGDFLTDGDPPEACSGKRVDIVFNATFDDMPRKRHRLMLELLCHPLLQKTTALFLGRGQESKVAEFRACVTRLGLGKRLEVRANLRRADVPRQLGRCRIGVHLSLYENACRSIYEFFRSGLPCVISSSMAGMNPTIFNEHTGMAVNDADLPTAIARVLDQRESFAPRRWFLENSGSVRSTQKLNTIFKDFYTHWGYDWQEDIVPLSSSGANRYAHPADYPRFRTDFEWLLTCLQQASGARSMFSID
jgi:hypothetical protein